MSSSRSSAHALDVRLRRHPPTPGRGAHLRLDLHQPPAWTCINRRLARDVERAAETLKALFQIAMIKLMARRIARFRNF
jgi:hypothetical protein